MKMKKIYNNIIPFKGFKAITIWPWVFVRKDASVFNKTDERHESIHLCQQLETLVASLVITCLLSVFGVISPWWILVSPLVYFVLYGLDWLVRWFAYGFDGHLAYRNISFEQEAYLNENDLSYPYERKLYSFVRYLFKKSYVRDAISRKIVKKTIKKR